MKIFDTNGIKNLNNNILIQQITSNIIHVSLKGKKTIFQNKYINEKNKVNNRLP